MLQCLKYTSCDIKNSGAERIRVVIGNPDLSVFPYFRLQNFLLVRGCDSILKEKVINYNLHNIIINQLEAKKWRFPRRISFIFCCFALKTEHLGLWLTCIIHGGFMDI